MTRLVLDAEAVSALADPRSSARRAVRRQLVIAKRLGRQVCVASVTLAELYRGSNRSRALDATLPHLERDGLNLRDTDRSFARLVGGLLYAAGLGSAHLADAHAVAAAVEAGGGVVLTADPDDLARLAGGDPRVVVVAL